MLAAAAGGGRENSMCGKRENSMPLELVRTPIYNVCNTRTCEKRKQEGTVLFIWGKADGNRENEAGEMGAMGGPASDCACVPVAVVSA